MNNIWQYQDAKSKFSELVERTLAHGAQIVTRRGRNTVVVLSFEEYERMTRPQDSLVHFLLNSPLADIDLSFVRDKTLPRDIGL